MSWIIAPAGYRPPAAPRRLRPATAVHPATRVYRETFLRANHPEDGTRPELWEVQSGDRMWRYRRVDEEGTPWALDRWNRDVAAFIEVATGFASCRAAREATADPVWVADLQARLQGRLVRPGG